MVLVKLTDTKTNTTYQLELSLEDFQKAQKDNQYKKKLLNDAIALCQNDSEMTEVAAKEDNGSDDEQDIDDPDEENQQNVEDILGEVSRVLNNSESRSEANISAAIDDGENGIRWGKEAIYLLLAIYRMKDSSGVFTNGKLSQKACWDMIAKDMTKHGHSFSWLQCQNKLISLKKSYRKIKLAGKKSNWQYFDIMDDIFSGKSFYQPINVASSSDYTKILIRRQKEAAAKAGAPRFNFGAESSGASFRAKLVKSDNTGLIEILERHLESLRRQRAERDERREAEKRRLELQKREDRLRFAEERRKDRARLIELLEKRCQQCDEI